MFDKEQEKRMKAMLAAYDRTESETLLKSAPEEFEFSEEFKSSIEKIRRKEITMTVNVKRILIIAAAIVLIISAITAASIGLVAQNDTKHKSTLSDAPGADVEVTFEQLDLTQLDFEAIEVPEGYTGIVSWERSGVWAANLETYPKYFEIIVDEVFDDTAIDVEAGIEYKTAEINGYEVIIKLYTETNETPEHTVAVAYIDYHYIRDNYYIFAQQTLDIPPESGDDYVKEQMISDKEVLKMMQVIEKQVRDVNNLK